MILKLQLLLLSVLFSSFLFAQKATLKIKVKDEDNLNLPGASVMLSPGNYKGITNQNGELILTSVQPGEYKLTISYIGYASSEKNVSVKDETAEIVEVMKAGMKTEKEVIVIGDRLKGQAKALNQQKNNLNVSNVISSDQVGRFPDANIGDALKRVAGVSMQNDQGEARNIIIRGMGPELNSVQLNGERIPSAEGDNRRVQLDLIPSDMVQTIEVSKSLTPEMDGDAIGGSVNLFTRAPSNGLRISGTGAGGFNPIRSTGMGIFSFIIGTRSKDKKFGWVLSGSYNSTRYGSDNVEALWDTVKGKSFARQQDVRIYDIKRTRRSGAVTLDYKITPKSTIYLTGMYNWRDDWENRFRTRRRYRPATTGINAPADFSFDPVTGEVIRNTKGEITVQTKGGSVDGRNDNARLEDQRVKSIGLRGEHVLNNKIKIEWNSTFARASEYRPNERYITFRVRNQTLFHNPVKEDDIIMPNNTDTVSRFRLNTLSELTEEFQVQYEEDWNSRINAEIPVNFIKGKKGSLKFGVRLRAKSKVRENDFYTYAPTSGNASNFANLTTTTLVNKTNPDLSYNGVTYIAGNFVSKAYLGGLKLTDPSLFTGSRTFAEFLATNYKAKETITAGFVQWKQELSEKADLIFGARVEHTATDYTGNSVTGGSTLKQTVNVKKNYTDVLPSLNIRIEPQKDFILRIAAASSLARPKYYAITPFFNAVPADGTITAGNPNLKPTKAFNIDFMLEKYFKSIGIVSAGIFYKNIKDYFYNYIDPAYDSAKFVKEYRGVTNLIPTGSSWQYNQTRNGDKINLFGFEVAIQRQLDFLPGFLKGLGVYLNYTYTKGTTDGIRDAAGNFIRKDIQLPGSAPHSFNASLSYESKRLMVRVAANYTASYVDDSDDGGYATNAYYDRYYGSQFFLDANASFAITKKFRIFAEANNLTNQPLYYYQGIKERLAQIEYYRARYNGGIKFDLSK
jgi:TonB-dependent receptor